MQAVLGVSGHIFIILAVVCLVLCVGDPGLLPFVPILFIVGIVLLSLSRILERISKIERLLSLSSDTSEADVVKTVVGEFRVLRDAEGEAMCLGCRKVVPKAGLYYNKSLDVYYHRECFAKDHSEQKRSP
ncbi:MAG: hypothetical protein JSU70_16180 [Phycisphaerales bacterium]|nr:MAG: hypothetical protein JSU70_16180 [Phycisphaerales bacterium]